MNTLKSIVLGLLILAAIIGAALWAKNRSAQPSPTESPSPAVAVSPEASASVSTLHNDMHEITISTNEGDIVFRTYDADAPKAVSNFIELASKGFYDSLTFHRVIEGFMIQGGDPKGDGTGGPGYKFEDELNPNTESYRRGYIAGTVAMANAGPDTNGSQFFIMHHDYALPHNYTIFGHVVAGQDVVDKIATVKTDSNDRPLTPVVMKKVTVTEVP